MNVSTVCVVITEAIFYTNNQVPVSSITQRIKTFPALHDGTFLVEEMVQSHLFGFLTLEDVPKRQEGITTSRCVITRKSPVLIYFRAEA
jgi:hypothetical protein